MEKENWGFRKRKKRRDITLWILVIGELILIAVVILQRMGKLPLF